MAYKIDSTYCWYSDWQNKSPKIVVMYFINGVPFTWDDLEDIGEDENDLPLSLIHISEPTRQERIS